MASILRVNFEDDCFYVLAEKNVIFPKGEIHDTSNKNINKEVLNFALTKIQDGKEYEFLGYVQSISDVCKSHLFTPIATVYQNRSVSYEETFLVRTIDILEKVYDLE